MTLMLLNESFKSEIDEVSAFFVLALSLLYFLYNVVYLFFFHMPSMLYQRSHIPFMYITFFTSLVKFELMKFMENFKVMPVSGHTYYIDI